MSELGIITELTGPELDEVAAGHNIHIQNSPSQLNASNNVAVQAGLVNQSSQGNNNNNGSGNQGASLTL